MIYKLVTYGLGAYAGFYTLATLLFDSDIQLVFYRFFGKSPRRLKGKVIFITGASSGIGEHIAYELAKHGVKLILTARRKDELERVKKTCLNLSKGQLSDNDILVIPMDLTNLSSHKQCFQQAVNHFGCVDILVNNAGRSQRAAWETTEIEVDKQMFELNVFAVVNLSRIAIDHFNKRNGGQLAVVSSLAGVIGVPFSGSYTGSKHAIHGYFNSLRNEKFNKNISVTLLCPGPTFSNFLSEAFTDKAGEKYNIPVQSTDRRMTAQRCAQLCAISIVNKASESWMGIFPMMTFSYVCVYFPVLFKMILKIAGPEKLFKLRDSRAPVLKENSS